MLSSLKIKYLLLLLLLTAWLQRSHLNREMSPNVVSAALFMCWPVYGASYHEYSLERDHAARSESIWSDDHALPPWPSRHTLKQEISAWEFNFAEVLKMFAVRYMMLRWWPRIYSCYIATFFPPSKPSEWNHRHTQLMYLFLFLSLSQ